MVIFYNKNYRGFSFCFGKKYGGEFYTYLSLIFIKKGTNKMIKNIYKKNLLSLFLALAMVISILPAGVFAANGTLSGEGTAESPYLIEDAAEPQSL